MSPMNEANYLAYDTLTSRTFYVVDTEYTPAPEDAPPGNRIISIAIVPVIAGRRAPKSQELYKVINPGVPISIGTTYVHGFTDEAVRRKPDFSEVAREICDFFDDPDAVFVSHTAADIHALRTALKLLDDRRAAGERTINAGMADLPPMPLIDTSTLPRMVRYPGAGRGFISLAQLAQITNVSFSNAHDARSDARATADALLALLRHVAQTGAYLDLDDLIREHNAGTTHNPRAPIYIRSRATDEPPLPPGHFDKHLSPLADEATDEQIDAWLEMALECSRLKCPWLQDEAKIAAPLNGRYLLDATLDLLPELTEQGQAGTLIGAIIELIKPGEDTENTGLLRTRAVRWWNQIKQQVWDSPACGFKPESLCPDCREHIGCPRDKLYEVVFDIALPEMTAAMAQTIFARNYKWDRWRENNPELLALAEWKAIESFRGNMQETQAGNIIELAISHGDHKTEPRLTFIVCDYLATIGQTQEAIDLAQEVLANRNSYTVYNDLIAWIAWTLSRIAEETAAESREPLNTRLARPAGRVPRNPYKVGR